MRPEGFVKNNPSNTMASYRGHYVRSKQNLSKISFNKFLGQVRLGSGCSPALITRADHIDRPFWCVCHFPRLESTGVDLNSLPETVEPGIMLGLP